jgi:hypothetical protein
VNHFVIGAAAQQALVFLPYCHIHGLKIESCHQNNNNEYDSMSYAMKEMFDHIDSKNIDSFLTFLADDVEFRFGNAPKLVGKAAIKAAVDIFNSQIVSMEHVLTGVWTPSDDITILEFDSYYTKHNGITVGVPCCVVLRFNDNHLIEDYRINIDLSPVFASAPESHLIRVTA